MFFKVQSTNFWSSSHCLPPIQLYLIYQTFRSNNGAKPNNIALPFVTNSRNSLRSSSKYEVHNYNANILVLILERII